MRRAAFSLTKRSYGDLISRAMLTEEQQALKQQVGEWAQAKLAPLAAEVDKKNEFPSQMWKELGDMGLLGVTVDPKYGGLGLGYLDHSYVMEEVSRASGSVGLSYGAHSNLCVNQIHRNGTEAQKEEFLPGLVAGDKVGALAMSEPGSGSDVLSMGTTAKKVSGGWELNGAKMWITNGPDCDVLVVYARTAPVEQKKNAHTAFVIDAKDVGRGPHLDKLGMRGSNTCELSLDGVVVPESAVLGQEGKGAHVLMSGLDLERLVLSAGPLGLAQAALDVTLPYIQERKQFGRPIGDFQLVQGKLADMYSLTSAVRSYVYAVGQACDSGREDSLALRKDCAGVILYAAEMGTKIALDAIQLLGGNGYTNEYPVARIMRDAKLYEIGAGTSEIRRWLIGRELVGDKK